MYNIALSQPVFNGNEWAYVKECLDAAWVSTAGSYVDLFEEKIASYVGVKHAIACVNGTSALHISLKLAGVENEDEVIVPTLTFIASVNAISYNGAKPVFMDVDEYYNINVDKTIHFIQTETKFVDNKTYNKKTGKRISALLPVHVWGNAVNLDDLIPLCKERNIAIIEDACESLGTTYTQGSQKGKHTGTNGDFGCISFNGNKIITAGGGGMILTDNEKLAERAKYITTQAKDNSLQYIHHEIGYNYRLSNIQAALGCAQLEQLPGILEKKRQVFLWYQSKLSEFSIAKVPQYADNNHWITVLQLHEQCQSNELMDFISKLNSDGIQARPVWTLNHLQEPYKSCQSYDIEVALELARKSLCLPSGTDISEDSIDYIQMCLSRYQ